MATAGSFLALLCCAVSFLSIQYQAVEPNHVPSLSTSDHGRSDPGAVPVVFKNTRFPSETIRPPWVLKVRFAARIIVYNLPLRTSNASMVTSDAGVQGNIGW